MKNSRMPGSDEEDEANEPSACLAVEILVDVYIVNNGCSLFEKS